MSTDAITPTTPLNHVSREPHELWHRRGILLVKIDIIRHDLEVSRAIFREFIPLRAECMFHMDNYVYCGLHAKFDVVKPDEIPPSYEIMWNVADRSDIKFVKSLKSPGILF